VSRPKVYEVGPEPDFMNNFMTEVMTAHLEIKMAPEFSVTKNVLGGKPQEGLPKVTCSVDTTLARGLGWGPKMRVIFVGLSAEKAAAPF